MSGPLCEDPQALLPRLPILYRVDTGAVHRPCGLGLSGRGCWGRSGQRSGTHRHTELPGHSRPQRPLQVEGRWVGLWSRVSGGRSPGQGGSGGCGVYGGPSKCSRHHARLLSPGPEPGGVRRASASTSRGCWPLGPGTHRSSCRPPPCVSAPLRHPYSGPPRGSSTSDASLTVMGKTLSHRSWDQDPNTSLRTSAQPTAPSLRLPGCPGAASAMLSARPLSQGYLVLRGLPPGSPPCLCPGSQAWGSSSTNVQLCLWSERVLGLQLPEGRVCPPPPRVPIPSLCAHPLPCVHTPTHTSRARLSSAREVLEQGTRPMAPFQRVWPRAPRPVVAQ